MSDSLNWTKEQSDQITELYGHLQGDYKARADKELFHGPQLPYDKAHGTLAHLLEAQEHQKRGLEGKVSHSKSKSVGRQEYGVGLLGALASVAAMAMGSYAIAAIGALAAGAILLQGQKQAAPQKAKH